MSPGKARRQKWAIRLIRFVAVAARTFHSCREGFTDPPPTAGESNPHADESQESSELGRDLWLSTETPGKQALWGTTSTAGSNFQGKFSSSKRPFLFKSITLVNESITWAMKVPIIQQKYQKLPANIPKQFLTKAEIPETSSSATLY